MILRIPEWEIFDWLDHGFGTRLSENWTHTPARTWVRQIHSGVVRTPDSIGDCGEGDALVTDRPGLLLEIRTADCIPVLLLDPEHRAIGAIHAGWRGTSAQIVKNTIAAMIQAYDSRPAMLQAAIGPGIESCCYEVGPEVAAQFGREGKIKLDLVEANRQQLLDCAIPARHILRTGSCTMCDSTLYFSFRRDKDAAGRMASAIGVRPAALA